MNNSTTSSVNGSPGSRLGPQEAQSAPSLQMRLQPAGSDSNLGPNVASTAGSTAGWTTAFNTSLLTTRADSPDRSAELAELMQSVEYQCLLNASQLLANQGGCSKEVATERLIQTFRRLDECWNQVILKRGMNTLLARSSK